MMPSTSQKTATVHENDVIRYSGPKIETGTRAGNVANSIGQGQSSFISMIHHDVKAR
jgi:hypothetical protein